MKMNKSPCDTCTLKQADSCPYVKSFEKSTYEIQQSKANCKKYVEWLKAKEKEEEEFKAYDDDSYDARFDDDRQEYSEPDYYEE